MFIGISNHFNKLTILYNNNNTFLYIFFIFAILAAFGMFCYLFRKICIPSSMYVNKNHTLLGKPVTGYYYTTYN